MNKNFKKICILGISAFTLFNVSACSQFKATQKSKDTVNTVDTVDTVDNLESNENAKNFEEDNILELINKYFGVKLNKDDIKFEFGEIRESDSGKNNKLAINIMKKDSSNEDKNSSLFILMADKEKNKIFGINNFIESDIKKTTSKDEKKQKAMDFLVDIGIVKEKGSLEYTGPNTAMTAMGEYTGFEFDYKGNFLSVGIDNNSGEPIYIFSPDLGLN